MDELSPWWIRGSYVEACNCDAVCPCRRSGARPGGLSTYGVCDFALSWHIAEGHAAEVALADLDVVLAGSYVDDPAVDPFAALGAWRVALYLDVAATAEQAAVLESIFLGRAGGGTLRNFAAAIGEVHHVRRARIELDHSTGHQRVEVAEHVLVRGFHPVDTTETVSCGIPGHDHPGTELTADLLRVEDAHLQWEVTGRCGFATDFDYASDPDG